MPALKNTSIYCVASDLKDFNYLNYCFARNVTLCQIRDSKVKRQHGKVRIRRQNLRKAYRKDVPRHLYRGIAQLAV